jgi:tetratricopeptide (TPR) repeat protein
MLETIREYALERLEQSGEADDLHRRHAEHFLALAEQAEPRILGVSPGDWLDRLEREHDNLRTALDRLQTIGESELAQRLAGTVWEFWCLRGHITEGWRRLEQLLALDERATPARAKALTGAAHLALSAGAKSEEMRVRAEQALALHRRMGDPWGIAYAEFQYAATFAEIGDFVAARPLLEESVQRLHEVGDEHRELQARRFLAWSYRELGDPERYRIIYEENLRRARAIGDGENELWALENLATVSTDEGRPREALTMLRQAYQLARDSGDPTAIDMNLVRFGYALAFANRAGIAVRLLSLSEAMHEELAWTYEGWFVALKEKALERARARLDEAEFAEAWEQGRKLTPDAAVALALGEVGSDAS